MSPLVVIVCCHFLSSFGILGMAPYYPTILERSFGQKDPFWGGLFYVLPLAVMAAAGPAWGWFADRFGKRLSLLRAQLGLAVVLLACGFARSEEAFAGCLLLQGLFGGTFSASNALLSQYYQGEGLAKALSYLQYSARLSLFAAPSAVGLLVFSKADPLLTYRLLWLLPAASLGLLLAALPTPPRLERQETVREERPQHAIPFLWLLHIEFWFTVMTVITFPYFVKFFPGPEKLAGLYFGLPHLIYLGLAFLVIQRASGAGALRSLALAFGLCSLAMLGHVLTGNLWLLLGLRVMMGVSLVFGFVYLNELLGNCVRPEQAGRAFGWVDTASKSAGVVAGLAASLLVRFVDLQAPFVAAAGIGAALSLATWRKS